MLNNEKPVPKTSLYRYSKIVWKAAKQVFLDVQSSLVKQCLSTDEELAVSFDMGWQKRYGFNSNLGMQLFALSSFTSS